MAVDLIEAISHASDLEINDVLQAVLQRYAELFPDWDVCTFSLQKKGDRNEQIDNIIRVYESLKKTP